MLYTTIQVQSFLGSGEEDFWEFLPYIGMVATCLVARNYLNKLAIPFWQKKSGENCLSGLREVDI